MLAVHGKLSVLRVANFGMQNGVVQGGFHFKRVCLHAVPDVLTAIPFPRTTERIRSKRLRQDDRRAANKHSRR